MLFCIFPRAVLLTWELISNNFVEMKAEGCGTKSLTRVPIWSCGMT